jgi:hypothetical protein
MKSAYSFLILVAGKACVDTLIAITKQRIMIDKELDGQRKCLEDHINGTLEMFENEHDIRLLISKVGENRIQLGIHFDLKKGI